MLRWKRNLIAICVSQLLTMMAFSTYLGSIAYYFQDLGAGTVEETASWVALFSSGSGIAMMVASPIWGGLADRFGRKLMLIRATLAGSVLALLMGIVQTPSQLIIVRLVQGVLCGTVSAAIALVATEIPEDHLGVGLGAMQTVQFVGRAVGPLIGGLAADTFGYRSVFPIAAGMMAASVLIVVLLVKERFRPARDERKGASSDGARGRLVELLSRGRLVLLLTLGGASLAMAILSPILALYVKALSPDATRIATLAGAMISITALTSSVAAVVVGRLADKFGQRALLIVCGLGVSLVYIPQAFVSTSAQLLGLRALEGVFVGGLAPTATAFLAKITPRSRRGALFGLSNSIQAGGRAIGPMIGASVARGWGMSQVFMVTSGIFALITLSVGVFLRREPTGNLPNSEGRRRSESARVPHPPS